MSKAFNALGVKPELTELLIQQGISAPTPVQRETIPLLLKEQDVIAQAQTGTGKTLAFALPMLQRIQTNKEQVQALILTPTRELALQITSELKKLASAYEVRVLAAYGGQDVEAQIRKLKHTPHIVVATPGRLIDHLTRGTVNLGKLSMLVLDEADQMLHMGFLPEVESIIASTPRARQTMLFSATMPEAIRRLASEYMNNPIDVQIKSTNVTLDNIKQIIVETTDRGKQRALVELLETHRPYLAVIFCRTKIRAKKLNEALQEHGFECDELHGDLTQAKREQVMKRFREAKLQMLVATDVAARGLDVEGVTHVYNYDVPQDAEIYIHRIGRTGRAGHSGMAVTLATPYDNSKLASIEKGIKSGIDRRKLERDGSLRTGGQSRSASDHPSSERAASRNRSRGGKESGKVRRTGSSQSTRSGRNNTNRSLSDGTSRNPWESSDLPIGDRSNDKSGGRSGGRSDNRSGGRSDNRSGGRSDNRSGGRSDNRSGGRSDSRSGGRSDGRSSIQSNNRSGGRSNGRSGKGNGRGNRS
ncbi:DEAD/DEAH box helicase [Paenibacillus sp. J5C_2022]|uniref:DEAD/DEAH box helicase n=1 Tax=Paenibacillus sp. J5C2022 TaxID=2977129 RepID=UPI0021D240E4|nr:DEAD/DEAH box helicase [Paenibacillus sp. J5C2022]MCU6707631.1 DEAD/DEAH box helicase [Paenibacillus sp. J5C2022]